MVRIFIGFMVIVLMRETTCIILNEFFNPKPIITWAHVISNEGISYCNETQQFRITSMSRLEQLIKKLNIFANKCRTFLDAITSTQLLKREPHFKKLYVSPILQHQKSILQDQINIVNNFHDHVSKIVELKQQIALDGKISNSTAVVSYVSLTFAKLHTLKKALEIIDHITFSIPNSVHDFFELTITEAEKNVPYNCDEYMSAQHVMLMHYTTIIITKMKGLATQIYLHSLIQHSKKIPKCTEILRDMGKKFEEQVMEFRRHITKSMARLPRVIHRCNMLSPKRGDDFIEFTYYHRLELISSTSLAGRNDGNYCDVNCANIDHNDLNRKTRLNIDNCRNLELHGSVDVCLAKSNSHRKYMWWTTPKQTYGKHEKCSGKLNRGKVDRKYMVLCNMCLCSVIDTQDYSDKKSILRISVTPQISDIANNMFVVGVKFVNYENAIHLKIQQNVLLSDLQIFDNSSVWKKLDNSDMIYSFKKYQYEPLAKFAGQIHLDDVLLPPGYVVTGVRFATTIETPVGFYLQVHGTPYKWLTGKLDAAKSKWFDARNLHKPTSSYNRNRIKIELSDPNEPTACQDYDYDVETNKYIQFTHSSEKKDGGQSTVPYLDAQPVEIYPSYPLSGIGLFHRGKKGCGGYIAPRIFAFNVNDLKTN